jgi:hypothetical protein
MSDINKIEAIYNTFLIADANVIDNLLTFNLQVPFTPDFLIVKSITYVPGANDAVDGIYPLSFSLLNPLTMGYFGIQSPAVGSKVAYPNNYDILFKINHEVKGEYTIQINNGLLDFTGDIGIHMQWIKYKSEPPQAIL